MVTTTVNTVSTITNPGVVILVGLSMLIGVGWPVVACLMGIHSWTKGSRH